MFRGKNGVFPREKPRFFVFFRKKSAIFRKKTVFARKIAFSACASASAISVRVNYLVFRKERLGERPMQRASRDALCVISTQRASRDALGTFFKKSIFFLFFWGRTTFFVEKSDFFRFFSVKSRANPTFSAKIAEKPRISANFRDFRDFSGKKKRSGH